MRLLLLLTMLIAVVTLLLASWQRGKRVFAVTATIVAIVSSVVIYGVVNPGKRDQVTLPPEGIRVEVADMVSSESGVRFTGTIFNDSDLDLAGITLQASAFACSNGASGASDCDVIDQQQQLLQLFIPAGRHYSFALVARHPEAGKKPDKWDITPLSKLAYPSL
ncbi:hypothetical protein [Alcanivorax sediminis]|uniref:Uncharacterized protein n=1 Tax=Alcanivorax sediminis TaxID=2663008 RepID=A0A6N7M132_9GAMM|nr:hypothetical protein [Alcanivorax sediminis]MQX53970.1 hypothetical protein [Alcanivorax sediminis]